MTSTYRLTSEGQDDIDGIWNAIAEHDAETAIRVLAGIEARFRLIARYPLIGRERGDLLPGLRSFPVGGYVILYSPTDDGVEVMRVLRGRRDIETALRG